MFIFAAPARPQAAASDGHYAPGGVVTFQPGEELLVPAAAVQLAQAQAGQTARVLCPIAQATGKLVASAGDDVSVLEVEERLHKVRLRTKGRHTGLSWRLHRLNPITLCISAGVETLYVGHGSMPGYQTVQGASISFIGSIAYLPVIIGRGPYVPHVATPAKQHCWGLVVQSIWGMAALTCYIL